MEDISIVTVNETNVEEEGFFCYKSKPKTEGYQRKLTWMKERFSEGMRIQILYQGKRSFAFIEYIPGEYAWRAVDADGYMFIHCLWVVGSGKNKGFATRLLQKCEEDARDDGLHGVAMVTSSQVWLVDNTILLKNGYEVVDQAPPSFDLLVKKFDSSSDPCFPKDWQARAARFGDGITVLRSDQCPYIPNAVISAQKYCSESGIPLQILNLDTADRVRSISPSPYGLFGIVCNGKLLSYHYLQKKDFNKTIAALT